MSCVLTTSGADIFCIVRSAHEKSFFFFFYNFLHFFFSAPFDICNVLIRKKSPYVKRSSVMKFNGFARCETCHTSFFLHFFFSLFIYFSDIPVLLHSPMNIYGSLAAYNIRKHEILGLTIFSN